MARADYEHWNEEADLMWWQEEGRHQDEPNYDPDPDFWSDGNEEEEGE